MVATRAVLPAGVSDGVVTLSASIQTEQGAASGITLIGTSITAGQDKVPLDVFVRGCPGCLDTTFGVKAPFDPMFEPDAIAIDAGDRIVVLGHVFKGPCVLVRLTREACRHDLRNERRRDVSRRV